jgi:four helix bundle protein
MSLGSLTELQNQLIIAKDLNYINEQTFNSAISLLIEVHKMLNAMIKSAQNRS